jgi:hypothetical protein
MGETSIKGLIFVSCGQVTQEERKLGADVSKLICDLTPYHPYFAENQTTLEGFTHNILGNLNKAIGFIAIMHPRGIVKLHDGKEETRGSVWIEQEIAIAAFMAQILRHEIRMAAYIHTDIRREGMRDQLLLNAVPFSKDSQVIENLRGVLPTWKLDDPIAERRWSRVRDDISKLPEYNREALRLLLEYPSLTDYTALQKLGQLGRQNSLASVLPGLQNQTGLIRAVPGQPPTRRPEYELSFEITPELRPFVERYFNETQ